MIIILEGVDAVGKDTFAELLSKKIGYEIVRGSSFEISKLGSDKMFSYSMELFDKKNIILNRSFYSNLVYGKLYNYPMMSQDQYSKLVEKSNKNAFVVYLHAPTNVIKHRMNNRGDDMIKQEEIDDILEEYKKVMHGYFTPKTMLSLNTDRSDFNIATAMVKEIINLDETKIYTKNT